MSTELLRVNPLYCRHRDEIPEGVAYFFSCNLRLGLQQLVAIDLLERCEQATHFAKEAERQFAGSAWYVGKAVSLACGYGVLGQYQWRLLRKGCRHLDSSNPIKVPGEPK